MLFVLKSHEENTFPTTVVKLFPVTTIYNRLQLATLLKLTLLHGCFLRFLNCTNGTKSRNALHFTNKTKHLNLKMEKISQREKLVNILHNHDSMDV